MKKTLLSYFGIGVLMAAIVPSSISLGQDGRQPEGTGGISGSYDSHPNIDRAIHALRAAKEEMEHASHDYCGHRVAALEATNGALSQLGLAIACDESRFGAAASVASYRSNTTAGGERHPRIREAIGALNAARADLRRAQHKYCGHRAEALEAANRALSQLQLALRCDRD